MARVLFLAHRLPYPPDKGDKIHTYHVLRHLGARHEVLLGTFIDDPHDEQHLHAVRSMCAEMHVARLSRVRAYARAMGSLARREALTLGYYRDAGLARWVRDIGQRRPPDAVVMHASSMLPYGESLEGPPLVADYNDVDSQKWAEYGQRRRWPMSWVYRREAKRLLEAERRGARRARWTLFATEREADLFRRLAPESAARVSVMGNGVDDLRFAPEPGRPSPFAPDERAVVFVGTMNYWPNVDAVVWFAQEILPRLREQWPTTRFHIVGRSPAPAVRRLASDAVHVTGAVADTRPWLQHASAVVAPMRIAPGIQNKILEAMAMACAIVATRACAEVLDVAADEHLLLADDVPGFVAQVGRVLASPDQAAGLGAAARRRVRSRYSWGERLARLDACLDLASAGACA